MDSLIDVNQTLVAEMFVQALKGEEVTYDIESLVSINAEAVSSQLSQIDIIKQLDPESNELSMVLADLSLFEISRRANGTTIGTIASKSLSEQNLTEEVILDRVVKTTLAKTIANSDVLPTTIGGVKTE